MSDPFVGEIRMFAFNFAPVSWALCNGQLLPINQNQALFSLLGTTYGGDGVTTFALPNLQSRVPVHMGSGTGLSTYILGETMGTENVTLTSSQMPVHNHSVQCSSAGGNQASPANGYPAVESTGTSQDYTTAPPDSTMNSAVVTPTGGGQSHTNIQPVLCLNFCIALTGIFPSRN
jgi:microcystin-dependent protein